MKKEILTKLLSREAELNLTHIKDLDVIVQEYPYFQAARAVQLKGLFQNQSLSYDAELKKAAAYTTDRSVLFDYITSDAFQQHLVSKRIKKRHLTMGDDEQAKEWQEIMLEKEGKTDQVSDSDLYEKSRSEDSVEKIKSDLEEVSKQEPSLKEDHEKESDTTPVKFDKRQQHSFSEWLKLTSVKPISREKSEPDETKKARSFREHEIINRFIEKSPKIKPPEKSESHSSIENEGFDNRLMTETLAKIYTKQKNYEKAIQAYKILILKNPKKSSFFADRIREIENSRENKK